MYFQPTIHHSQNLIDFLPLSMPFCAFGAKGMGREKIIMQVNLIAQNTITRLVARGVAEFNNRGSRIILAVRFAYYVTSLSNLYLMCLYLNFNVLLLLPTGLTIFFQITDLWVNDVKSIYCAPLKI